MKLIENNSLLDFSNLLEHEGKRLYVVGGFVRDRLLGKCESELVDIDLASSATIEDLLEFSKDSGAIITPLSKDLGVAKIFLNGKNYEHATFRREETRHTGVHYPTGVSFIDSIKEDSERRDFTINALYYDINHERIVDYYGGLDDLKNKVVRCIGDASVRIKEDSERILRAVRLAVCLNFNLELSLSGAIKDNAALLENLKLTRKSRELYKMIVYASSDAKLFSILSEFGLLKYTFPQIYGVVIRQKKFLSVLNNINKVDNEFKMALIVDFCKKQHIEDEGVLGLVKYLFENYKENEICKNLQKNIKNIEFFTKKRIKPLDVKTYIEDNKLNKDEMIRLCEQIGLFYNERPKRMLKILNKLL